MSRQKSFFVKVVFLVCCVLSFIQVSACRYTIREIGYTDLGDTDFNLYMFIDNDTSKETINGFQQVGYAMLFDTNVKISTVNVDTQLEHPAIKYSTLKTSKEALVELILVSPLGKAKLISRQESYEKDEFWELMEALVNSEIRTKMTLELAKSYGVLFLVEGKDPIENKRIRKVAEKAMEEIHSITALMAKPVDVPVRLYVLPYKNRKSEEVLLWSLGVSIENEEPSLVTLFGRGRMMGEPLRGKHINLKESFKLLSIIGADCECGLDRKWMLGSTIPLSWSLDNQSVLFKELGFDVENPMVKSEMSQIMSINLSVIEKISTTSYVNSLERSKGMKKDENANEEVSIEVSTDEIFLYTFFVFIAIIGIVGGVFFIKNKRK